jgi:hypothetical protein
VPIARVFSMILAGDEHLAVMLRLRAAWIQEIDAPAVGGERRGRGRVIVSVAGAPAS